MTRSILVLLIAFLSLSFQPLTISENGLETKVMLDEKIVISPNPARSYTKVVSKSPIVKVTRVEVYSMVNEKVIEVKPVIAATSVELNVYRLNKGKYFVKVYLSDNSEEFATLIKI